MVIILGEEKIESFNVVNFTYSLSLFKIEIQLGIFICVWFAFLSYRLLSQVINRSRHLLFCHKIITVVIVELKLLPL